MCSNIYNWIYVSNRIYHCIYIIFIHWGNYFSLNYIVSQEISIADYGILSKDEKLPSNGSKYIFWVHKAIELYSDDYSKPGTMCLLLISGLQSLERLCTEGVMASALVSAQGGFDIPERMFYNVGKEWESASRDNMGDVRELIPEFFYLPDFLLNSNNIHLGQTLKYPLYLTVETESMLKYKI